MQVRTNFIVTLKRTSALAFGIAALLSAGNAQAQTLGAASDYNVFVFGNHSARNVDVQGKVAVGGNATYNNYTIATKQPTGAEVNTVVGGNYTNSNGTVNGSIVVGGDLKHVNPSINGNASANGSVDFSGGGGTVGGSIKYGTTYAEPNYDINSGFSTTQGATSLPVNFAAAQGDLTSKSAQFAALAPTTNATFQNNNIFVTAANTGLTVVNLTVEQLQSATSFNYSGSTNSTLLINITNPNSLSSLLIPNTGTSYSGGFGTANLLYNIAATNLPTINLSGSFFGSLLAPNATVNATFGGFNGQLIANTLNGGGLELHTTDFGNNGAPSTYFKGNIPGGGNGNQVPEPGTLALLGAGAPLAMGALRRRMKKA